MGAEKVAYQRSNPYSRSGWNKSSLPNKKQMHLVNQNLKTTWQFTFYVDLFNCVMLVVSYRGKVQVIRWSAIANDSSSVSVEGTLLISFTLMCLELLFYAVNKSSFFISTTCILIIRITHGEFFSDTEFRWIVFIVRSIGSSSWPAFTCDNVKKGHKWPVLRRLKWQENTVRRVSPPPPLPTPHRSKLLEGCRRNTGEHHGVCILLQNTNFNVTVSIKVQTKWLFEYNGWKKRMFWKGQPYSLQLNAILTEVSYSKITEALCFWKLRTTTNHIIQMAIPVSPVYGKTTKIGTAFIKISEQRLW